MNEVLQNVLYAVITTVLPILVGYGISYLKAKREEKLQNIDNTYVKQTITEVTDTIINVVNAVSQTYVEDLKENGKFDETKQKEALDKAIAQAKDMINADAEKLIVDKYNDLDTFIRNTIESYIKTSKTTNSLV